jgi:zinc/manganese transport system substrate-binding protein
MMPVYARALAQTLSERDPEHKTDYDQRLEAFLTLLQPMQAKITEIRGKFAGAPVTATEPVVGYMATALGLKMRNERFQVTVMNDAEPRVSDVTAFENDSKKHQARLLFYNSQASSPPAHRMVRIAQQANIPVVGVTETELPNTSFQDWMTNQLDAIAKALSSPG